MDRAHGDAQCLNLSAHVTVRGFLRPIRRGLKRRDDQRPNGNTFRGRQNRTLLQDRCGSSHTLGCAAMKSMAEKWPNTRR